MEFSIILFFDFQKRSQNCTKIVPIRLSNLITFNSNCLKQINNLQQCIIILIEITSKLQQKFQILCINCSRKIVNIGANISIYFVGQNTYLS